MSNTTIEQTDAENALKLALDRYNQIVLGISDEGDLVEQREEQLELIETHAAMRRVYI